MSLRLLITIFTIWTQGTKTNGKNQPTIKVPFFKTPFAQLIEDKKPQTTWKNTSYTSDISDYEHVISENLSLKYQRFTPSGWKDIGINKCSLLQRLNSFEINFAWKSLDNTKNLWFYQDSQEKVGWGLENIDKYTVDKMYSFFLN